MVQNKPAVAFNAYKPKQFIIRYLKVSQLIFIPNLFVMDINKKYVKTQGILLL